MIRYNGTAPYSEFKRDIYNVRRKGQVIIRGDKTFTWQKLNE